MARRFAKSRNLLTLAALLAACALRAGAEPTPGPKTKAPAPKDEGQLWAEIQKEPTGDSGTYGQALSYLTKHGGDETRMNMLANSLARLSPWLSQALERSGGGQVTADGLKAFLKDSANHRAAAVLVDAARNEGTRKNMLDAYSDLKSSGTVGDFNSFLGYLAKHEKGPETVDRIVTKMSQQPAAPKAEDQRGAGDDSTQGRGRKPRSGKASPADIERLNRTYWNADEMYGKAGDANVVSLGGRVIAFNIVTVKGADGQMTQRLAVYDRTDPNDVHGRSFELSDKQLAQGIKFKMDDREGSTHPDEYTLQLVADPSGKDAKIVFKGDAGSPEVPSVKSLFKMRAQKILDYGYVVKVGDKEYYLGGEGYSDAGQNTFWDIEKLKKSMTDPDFDPTQLVPDMVTVSVQLNKETKKFEPVARNSIGQVNGKWYDLVWNQEKGLMEIVEGTAPSTPGGPTPGAGELTEDGWAKAFEGGITLDRPEVAGINAKLKAAGFNVRVYAAGPDQPLGKRYVLAAKDGKTFPNQFIIGPQDPKALQGFDIVGGSILAARFDTGVRYYDAKAGAGVFKQTWTWNDKSKHLASLDDHMQPTGVPVGEAVLRDALKRTSLAGRVDDFLKNVHKAGEPMPVTIYFSGDGAKAWAEYAGGKPPMRVWPDVAPDATGPKPSDLDITGNGFPMDPETIGASTSADNYDSLETIGDKKAKRVAVSSATVAGPDGKPRPGAGAALYSTEAEGKTDWQLYLVIQHSGGVSRYGPKLVFQDPAGVRIKYPGDGKVHIQGLSLAGPLPNEGQLKWGPRKDGPMPFEVRGIYAAWDGEKGGKWGNCVGVVAYWGMTRQEAQALCEEKQ